MSCKIQCKQNDGGEAQNRIIVTTPFKQKEIVNNPARASTSFPWWAWALILLTAAIFSLLTTLLPNNHH